MRHRKAGVKLNRTSSHRKAMFRNMVTSLLKHDRITTTDTKAKELRSWADQLITLAKRGDLHARRQALSIVREKDVVHKLFEEAPKRFGTVSGGYTRVIKVGPRPGDAAMMSIIELVTPEAPKKKTAKKKKTAAPKKAAAKKAAPKKAAPKKVAAKKAASKKTAAKKKTAKKADADTAADKETAEISATPVDVEAPATEPEKSVEAQEAAPTPDAAPADAPVEGDEKEK